jgi:hypothetical protein
MLRVHGLPATFAFFRTAIAVWFQSVMTSAFAEHVANDISIPNVAAVVRFISLLRYRTIETLLEVFIVTAGGQFIRN